MPSTPNGLPYPLAAAPPNVPADIQALAEAVDARLTSSGSSSARPASGTVGQRYFAADIVADYVWTGSTWVRTSMPAGALIAVYGADHMYAPPGYLLCYGQTVVNAQVLYAELYAAFPPGNRSGANLIIPDWRGNTIRGLDNMGGTDANRMGGLPSTTIGAAGGNVLIDILNLPAHQHVVHTDAGAGAPAQPHYHMNNGSSGETSGANQGSSAETERTGFTGGNSPYASPYACANIIVKL